MPNPAPHLIVMLTYRDRTVPQAAEVFAQCRHAPAEYWGCKEEGLPLPQLQALFAAMKACGKKTALEVVAYTEAEGLRGAQMAADCGCDLLLGTVYSDAILALCQAHGMRYMPFVGQVRGRPSVLEGTAEQMIRQAQACLQKGVFGFDLLGYRYRGDAGALIRRFVAAVPAPVCVAGSVDSLPKLDELRDIAPWAFTIGSAFFDEKFGPGFAAQILRVARYLHPTQEGADAADVLPL